MQATGYGINAYNDFTSNNLSSAIKEDAEAGYDCIKSWEDVETGNYFGK